METPQNRPSLRKELLARFRAFGGWINGGKAEIWAAELGYKPSNGSRRCRELAEDHLLDSKINDKGCVEYRFINTETLF